MYLTLSFKNKNRNLLESKKFDKLETALENLKEKYFEECFDHDFEPQEIEFIEAHYDSNHELLDHKVIEEEWNKELKRYCFNCKTGEEEQKLIAKDYKANLL